MKQVLIGLLSLIMVNGGGFAMGLSLESPAFSNNADIPSQYTCDGANLSPPLVWDDPSSDTVSYVLIMTDPDAANGNWDHWVLANIPAEVKQLNSGVTTIVGMMNGKNSWGGLGYRGPCPPSGTHRYLFTLYSLDTMLHVGASATKNEVMQAMQGHVIATITLIGRYQKHP